MTEETKQTLLKIQRRLLNEANKLIARSKTLTDNCDFTNSNLLLNYAQGIFKAFDLISEELNKASE